MAKRASIDDSIGSVLCEIETWAAATRRDKDDQQASWQAAMDEAERLATHDHLAAELEQQAKSWRLIQDLRQYCDALEARIDDANDEESVDERGAGWPGRGTMRGSWIHCSSYR